MFATRKSSLAPVQSSILSDILSGPALQEQNTGAWVELRAIAAEKDTDIFRQSLFVFGNRQEDAGNEALAARVYQALQTGAPQGGEVAQRAHSRLRALLGEGGSFGDQFEVSLRHFREQAPVAVATMLPGFLAFKTFRLGVWNGLLKQAASNLLTRGLGAEAFAGLMALLAEGPVMTATQRAVGQQGASWRNDLLANYRMMLGLRAAGGAVSLLGRIPGAPQGIWQSVAHQVGTLGGLTLAQGGDLTWSQTFQTLGNFHLTAALTGGFLGKPFAAREAALAQAGTRPTVSGTAVWQASLETGSPRLAQAAVGTVEPAQRSLRVESSSPPWQFHKVLARGHVEGTGGSSQDLDTTGIKLLRKIRTIDIPNVRTESFIRRWIDAQPIAINVAHIVVNTRTVVTATAKTLGLGGLVPGSDRNDVAQMRMLNIVFRQRLGWEESAVIGSSFRMFFEASRESFLAAAVSLAKVNQDWEFGPREVPVKFADGTFFPLVCAGTVRQVGDVLWAFGAFTGFPGEASSPSPPPTSVTRPTGFPPAGDSVYPPPRPSTLARSLGVRDAVDAELEEGRRAAGLPPDRRRDDS